MNLEVVLNEISETQKDKHSDSTYTRERESANLKTRRVEYRLHRGWTEGRGVEDGDEKAFDWGRFVT